MPTFSPIAFDRLLEPGSRNSKQPMRCRQVSPALYATPKATQLPHDSPSSPSSFSPVSPYIINHKRRGASLSEIKTSENNNNEINVDINGGAELAERIEETEEEGEEKEEFEGELEVENSNNLERESETDFFEFNDSMSNVSESFKPGTPNGEFYDAFEEISSESGVTFNSSSNRGNNNDIEEEMREMRLSLLMEIEKRKQTEDSLSNLQNQWLKLSQQLSFLGLNLRIPQFQNSNSEFEFETDPVEDLCDQIRVSRAVREAVERGISRAELASEIEKIIQAKNFEISRLTDRVQYYEAANREMTHRNQEAIEMARQERNKKKRRQKWFYASIGFAVTLGSAAIVWSYLPASRSVQINKKESD
ncbi:hypothetical protein LUZ60_012855 [Juncus effusus]|nr:hypothetical protein LUZ60_012855 [Juncus effusus]